MSEFDRRQFIGLMAAAAASMGVPWSGARADANTGSKLGPSAPFSWNGLIEEAKRLAHQPYRPSLQPDQNVLEKIDWAAHGQIRFKPEDALFAKGPGQYPVEFFHPGKFFRYKVRMYRLDAALGAGRTDTTMREILYDGDQFEMPAGSPARGMGAGTGYAGFRIQESRTADQSRLDWRYNDWAAFLGASYFRAIGDQYQYGLSARGVAVNVVEQGKTEEFPAFTRFYFEPGKADSDTVIVYALLDGPSLAGAYRFAMTRESGVVMDIEANLFLRRDIDRFGIAPVTSMYWFSGKDKAFQVDWRPEVHDSDGLALWTGANEHIWRPLIDPKGINISYFSDDNPRGFGLVQRERRFDEYLDAVHYEKRPSLWVEPLEGWGKGTVQLVELHTEEELYDNIVAMWVPSEKARAGSSHRLRYRLYWAASEPFETPLARCVSTRIGRGGEPANRPRGVHKFVVEFRGGALDKLPQGAVPEAVLTTSRGSISNVATEPVPDGVPGHWRTLFDLGGLAEAGSPAEIRLFLRHFGETLSETWLYQFHTA